MIDAFLDDACHGTIPLASFEPAETPDDGANYMLNILRVTLVKGNPN